MIGKINALELYKTGKEENLLYKLYRQTLKGVASNALKHGLAQFVLHTEDFQEELYNYNHRSLYKIDLIETLEELTFKGLQDLFDGRFVVDVRLMGDDSIAYATPKIFVYLLDVLENDSNKEFLEKRYEVLVNKYK